jgi:hypothetical protein
VVLVTTEAQLSVESVETDPSLNQILELSLSGDDREG